MEPIQGATNTAILGRYRPLHQIAEGGMGKVLLGRIEGAEGFKRPVVLKVMRQEMVTSDEGNRLFKREAQILSKMQHPAIPNILDFGVENGSHIMVLEYVHGYSAAKWLDYRHAEGRHLPVDVCLFLVRRVLDALDYAHHFTAEDGTAAEIIHRDVAADNLLLDKNGYIYLLDFGIASMSGPARHPTSNSGVFRGKLGYAAPETLLGEPATQKSDQYSAAIVLLEMLSLEIPFNSPSAAETVRRMANEPPPRLAKIRPDAPPGLDDVIQRALAKQAVGRFPSVRELSRELRRYQKADDEEVTLLLRQQITDDFERLPDVVNVEPLHVREVALAQDLPALQSEVQHNIPSPLPAPPAKNMWPLVLGLLAVAALAVGALFAFVLQGRGGQVVVVGSEGRAAPNAPVAAASAPKADPAPSSSGETLADAIHAHGPALEACFLEHLELAQASPEAVLRFAVPAGSGRATVSVQPAGLEKNALGACLAKTAEAIRFPEQKAAISFRIPVRARFAKVN